VPGRIDLRAGSPTAIPQGGSGGSWESDATGPRRSAELVRPEPTGPPLAEPAAESGPTHVTYLGHATVLVATGEEMLLTDPVFSDRIGRVFTKRTAPSTFRPEELRGRVGVLISHAHHDHLDYPSMRRLPTPHSIIVPWGLAAPMRWRGFPGVRVLRPWESTTVGAWTVTAVPSRHFGGRLPLVGTSGHLGFVLSGPSCIYFAGDTGLDLPLFGEIGRRFAIDLAILPIAGAVFPWFRPNHMNAVDALRAFACLGARQMLPIHYGTFPASFEPAGEPLASLVRESNRSGLGARVRVLPEGASLSLPGTGRAPVEASPAASKTSAAGAA
jgi:L-ascorbate metabolism protein UlaG (beta-lactamase superfamily)